MGGANDSETGPNRHDRAADERDQAAHERDLAADERDRAAQDRDEAAEERQQSAADDRRSQARRLRPKQGGAPDTDQPDLVQAEPVEPDEVLPPSEAALTAEQQSAQLRADRQAAAEARRQAAAERERSREYLARVRTFEAAAAEDRRAAAEDRRAAAHDRELANSARQQDAIERAERTPHAPELRGAHPPARRTENVEPPDTDELPALPSPADPAVLRHHGLELARRAVALSAAIASTEERIAETLHEMGRQGTESMARRRRDLAEDAERGIVTAAQHGERLQRLAERSAEHAEMAALQSLVHHAGTVLREVARTEQSIAAALERLAHFDDALAEQRLQESREATQAAQQALSRAERLHRIGERQHTDDSAETPG